MSTIIKIEMEEREEKNVVKMSEMKPCDVGVIIDGKYKNSIVMRTQNISVFEVINLTLFEEDRYWKNECSIPVRLVDAEITVKIKEKE